MNTLNDTIIALCSGAMQSSIAVIRISGPDAFSLVNQVFSNKKEHLHQHVYYGFIEDNGQIIDEVMATYYYAPHSFSSENMVEISCHGNMKIVSAIMSLLISKGAKMAERGEFSKRAFLGGRIDLIKAEAINDLIKADSDSAIRLALSGVNGQTSQYISSLMKQLQNVIAQIEVNIDYPEYDDVEQLKYDNVLPLINDFIEQLVQTIQDAKKGETIKNGISCAIIGKPNVGKSSLLNALLKQDKAIVTNIAGTTRDIVEGSIQINGITLNLIDTAGIHNAKDEIEKIGIKKSLESLNQADLILLVLDGSCNIDQEDQYLLKQIEDKKHIIVINKIDVNQKINLNNAVYVSAKLNELKDLESKITEELKDFTYENEPLLFNTRQIGLLNQALSCLKNAKKEAENGQVIDIISIDLKETYNCFLEILGRRHKEDLLDHIFSNFCLGK